MIEQFSEAHGFDDPLPAQFGRFLQGVIQLDFGDSIWQNRPALDAVLEAYPPTLLLAALTMVVAVVIPLILGSLAAVYRDRAVDRAITTFSLALASIPEFWFALMAILIFAVNLGWFPTSGMSGPASWVLPVATLALTPVGVLTQVVRGAMVDTLDAGYIRALHARGISPVRAVFKHGLRNAALPIVSVTGDRAAGLINGALIIGTVFALPGIGTLLVQAVFNRDFAVIEAGVFVTGVGIIVLNILVDVLYAVADPRVRVA